MWRISMKIVRVYKTLNNGEQQALAECKLNEDNIVACTGDADFVNFLTKEGIKNYSSIDPMTLYAKDGLIFLSNLKFNYKSGYIDATEVMDE